MSDALDRMTTQLTDRADYIADFAATVSHELKTPITGIRGAAELLADEWERMPDAQRRRFLANIDADAARMERLVTRLLELARIQNEPDAAQEIALGRSSSGSRALRNPELHVSFDGAPPALAMNPDHLESAVRNLVENALRHGAGRPVEVRVQGRGGRVQIAVRDRGEGISEAIRGRIFERFFTTERDAAAPASASPSRKPSPKCAAALLTSRAARAARSSGSGSDRLRLHRFCTSSARHHLERRDESRTGAA